MLNVLNDACVFCPIFCFRHHLVSTFYELNYVCHVFNLFVADIVQYSLNGHRVDAALINWTRSTPGICCAPTNLHYTVSRCVYRSHFCISDPVTCAAKKCPRGSRYIGEPSATQCTNFQWTESECCEKVCSSKMCPAHYSAKPDSDTIVCGDNGWTEELCCDKRESLLLF